MLLALDVPGPVRLLGFNAQVGFQLLYTLVLIAVLTGLRFLARWLVGRLMRGREHENVRFWARQIVNIAVAVIFVLGLLSVWFTDPARLATGLGLFSAGVAFALQQVITSLAGYLLILRGDMFTIGDRVVIGGVRGDVIGLGFVRTTIMEIGAPARAEGADTTGDNWVHGRQYTGRIVTVANSSVFNAPVYNYTRDFPYLWEELSVPIRYSADRKTAERVLLDVAQRHSVDVEHLESDALKRMQRRYFMPPTDLEPAVFRELTDNWIALTVRFAVPPRGIRRIKSDMAEEILTGFEAEGISVASSTLDISAFPPVQLVAGGKFPGSPND